MADKQHAADRKLEIKKYPNRRYYDATHSRHMTLEEIRSLIQQGYDVRVTDAKTSADITAQVLAQIILELETPKLDSFPVPLLLRVIRMNDQLVKDFIEKYFNQALKSFLDYQVQLEENIRKVHGLPASFTSVTEWTKAMFTPFTSAFGTSANGPSGGPAAFGQGNSELRETIQNLQQQITALKGERSKKKKKTIASRKVKRTK